MAIKPKYYYSLAYILLLGVPTAFVTFFVNNSINLKAVGMVTLICLIVGGIFDIWAVKQTKGDKFYIWQYNKKSILGIKFFGVPLEDFFLFLILTPIFIISLYEGVKQILEGQNFIPFLILALIALIASYRFIYRFSRN